MATFDVTDDTFEKQVIQAKKPILVDFWAAWCGPCKRIEPVVEELAEEYAGKMLVARMDVDENRQTPGQYNVQGIPALVLFKNGEEVTRLVGFRPKEMLVEELLPHI